MTEVGKRASVVPESATDVVDYLTEQHRKVAHLLEETIDGTDDQRAPAFTRFRRLLAVHDASEQEIIHPRARHELAEGSAVVAARLDEEARLFRLIASIERLDPLTPAFVDGIATLRSDFLVHLRREEDQEFAGLRIQLGTRQLRRMSNAVELAARSDFRPNGGNREFTEMMSRARGAICAIDGDES